eukprot:Colp12_sorted_trinity150504_noHs@31418
MFETLRAWRNRHFNSKENAILHWFTLKFRDPELERSFLEHSVEKAIQWLQVVVIMYLIQASFLIAINWTTLLPATATRYTFVIGSLSLMFVVGIALTKFKPIRSRIYVLLAICKGMLLIYMLGYPAQFLITWREDTLTTGNEFEFDALSVVPIINLFFCDNFWDELDFVASILFGLAMVVNLFIADIVSPADPHYTKHLGYLAAHVVLLYSGWVSRRQVKLIFYNLLRHLRDNNVQVKEAFQRAGTAWLARAKTYEVLVRTLVPDEPTVVTENYDIVSISSTATAKRSTAVRRLSLFKNDLLAVPQALELSPTNLTNMSSLSENGATDDVASISGKPVPLKKKRSFFDDVAVVDPQGNTVVQGEFSKTPSRVGVNDEAFVEVSSGQTLLRRLRTKVRETMNLEFEDPALEEQYCRSMVKDTLISYRFLLFSMFFTNTLFCVSAHYNLPATVPELLFMQLPAVTGIILFFLILGFVKRETLTLRYLHYLMLFSQVLILLVDCLVSRIGAGKVIPCEPNLLGKDGKPFVCKNLELYRLSMAYNMCMVALDTTTTLKLPRRMILVFSILSLILVFSGGIPSLTFVVVAVLLILFSCKYGFSLESKLRMQFMLSESGLVDRKEHSTSNKIIPTVALVLPS